MSDQQFLVADVSKAIQVKGIMMSYTHFEIGIKRKAFPNGFAAENSSVYPIAPYQMKILKRSRKLITWSDDTKVERRYSELVDLRTYLTMSYPMLIFPPLPPKSHTDNINTTLASDVHLLEQRRAIRRFLDGLLCMHDVVHYDGHVLDALQQARDVYVQDGLVSLRADLAALTSAQAHIDDHKSIHQRAGSTSTAALVEGTSKALRGFMSFVSGAPAVSPYMETARAQMNSDGNYTRWLPILQYVRELNISLSKSAEELLKLLVPLDEMNVATLNIMEPLVQYDQVLNMCDWFKPLSSDVVGFSQVFASIGNAHKNDVDVLSSRVVELMRLEGAWMASAEAAVEYLLALFLHVATLMADPYKCSSAEASNYKNYLDSTCATLSTQIGIVTGPSHSRRMHLLLGNYVKIFSVSLDAETREVEQTQYYARRLGESKQSAEDDWAEQLQSLPWKA